MGETDATPPAETPTARTPGRPHLVLARLLTIVGIVLVVISLFANYVKREALDESQFRSTSRALIADPVVRDQLAATLVDQLYANVDVSSALAENLPSNLQGLSGPIAGAARTAVDNSAQRLLERPRVQDTFVTASSFAQRQFVAVLDGDTKVVSTTGGKVVLDARPLVLDLGNRFSFIPNLERQIPEGTAQVTILESDQLKSAQDLTKALRFVANWIWALAVAAWAGAIWLARGRRRIELRAIAIGVVVTGFLVLMLRALAGRYIVDNLVASDSVRPAAARAWDIITELLAGAGWTAVIVGAVALLGVWLAGDGRRSSAARQAVAPYLRRPQVAYGGLAVAYLLLLWWRPTPQFGFWLNVVLFFVFAVLGLEALRRQTAREFPEAEPGHAIAAARSTFAAARQRSRPTGTTAELERLAALHESGALDDAEFATAKERLLVGAGR